MRVLSTVLLHLVAGWHDKSRDECSAAKIQYPVPTHRQWTDRAHRIQPDVCNTDWSLRACQGVSSLRLLLYFFSVYSLFYKAIFIVGIIIYVCVHMCIHTFHCPAVITLKPVVWFSCYHVQNVVSVKAGELPLCTSQGHTISNTSNWQSYFWSDGNILNV